MLKNIKGRVSLITKIPIYFQYNIMFFKFTKNVKNVLLKKLELLLETQFNYLNSRLLRIR
jgi:hypothetical protein